MTTRKSRGAERPIGRWAIMCAAVMATSPCLAAHLDAAPSPVQQDSAKLLTYLKGEQKDFERTRRRHLRVVYRSGRGRCDEQIGRYCFRHDNSAWDYPPEHERITSEREKLLAELAAGAARLRADPWIMGQRLRYLFEVNRDTTALEVARSCEGAPWWCLSVLALAWHSVDDFAQAEATFNKALRQMPDTLRCQWSDISLLLEHEARDEYKELECADRSAFEERFWWLADPLYVVPGNERRSEHFARLVRNEIHKDAETVYNLKWGRDNRELLVRYGPNIGWERKRPVHTITSYQSIVGYGDDAALSFAPRHEFQLGLTSVGRHVWDLDVALPRTVYAPPYSRTFVALEHQLAVFQEGDSAVVMVAYHWPDSVEIDEDYRLLLGDPDAALGLSQSEVATSTVNADGLEPLWIQVPIHPVLLSLESLSREDSVAGRARYWLDIPGRLDSSGGAEVLLTVPVNHQFEDRFDALPFALRRLQAVPGQRIQLYWELYDLPALARELRISLTIERQGKGFFRQIGEWVGVVGERQSTELEWIDSPPPGEGPAQGAFTIDMPQDPGEYTVRLSFESLDGHKAVVEKAVLVADRP